MLRFDHLRPTVIAFTAVAHIAWAPFAGRVGAGAEPRVLTLDEALARAHSEHPALRAAEHEVSAARSRADASGKALNPSFSAAVENVGGDLGGGHAETSLRLEQPIELGGDRDARAGTGQAGVALSQAEHDAIAQEIDATVRERTIDAWEVQERVWKLRAAEALAERAVGVAEERRKTGAAPAFELARATGFSNLRAIDRRRAEAELAIARARLASLWGEEASTFDSVALVDPVDASPPPLDTLKARLAAHPRRARANAEAELSAWRARQARAKRVPDLAVGAGVRRLAEVPGTGFEFGVSLPLPLWNAGGAEVAASDAELAAARARERSEELALSAELEGAYTRYFAAVEARDTIRERLVPASRDALRLVGEGYRSGRLGSLEIQEAQRNLLEAELELVTATAAVWRARSVLESLAGRPNGATSGVRR